MLAAFGLCRVEVHSEIHSYVKLLCWIGGPLSDYVTIRMTFGGLLVHFIYTRGSSLACMDSRI